MKRKHERDEPNSYVDGEIYTTTKTTSEFRNVSVTVQECVSDGGRGRRAGAARKADPEMETANNNQCGLD